MRLHRAQPNLSPTSVRTDTTSHGKSEWDTKVQHATPAVARIAVQ